MAVYKPRREASQETKPANTLIQNLRTQIPVFSAAQTVVLCYGSPSNLKQLSESPCVFGLHTEMVTDEMVGSLGRAPK